MNIPVSHKPGTQVPVSGKPAPARPATENEPSIVSLLKQLAHEVPLLFTKELGLAKAEARESMQTMIIGVGAVAAGGAVMLAGLIIVLLAAAAVLSLVLPPWLAGLIVGVAALLVGAAMVVAGKKQFSADALKPQRTMESLKKDTSVIQEKVA